MKNTLSAVIAIALATGSSMAASQTPTISGLPESPYSDQPLVGQAADSGSSSADARPLLNIDPDIPVNLSPAEMALINAKREAIVQYLYEAQELSGLRNVLRQSEHEMSVQDTLRDQVPLSPEDIRVVRQALRESALAENAPLVTPPELQMRTVDLNIDGQVPLEVRVARGYSSSIVFFDETGAPWPLQTGVDAVGDATAFSAQTVSELGHVATFQVIKEFAQSNALIVLEGLPVPVVLRLIGSDKVVDSRLSVRIPRHGPNAKVQAVYRNEVDNAPPEMMSFLNGESLSGSVQYHLDGVPGEVVKSGNVLYLRTRASLISPPPIRSIVSASGYNVYTLPPVTHLLFSVEGELREANIETMYAPTLAEPEDIFAEESR